MTKMTRTFKNEFDGIIAYIESRGLATPFDNAMGLVNIDRMIDILIPTPELKAELHRFVRELLQGMMKAEYADEGIDEDETLIGYV